MKTGIELIAIERQRQIEGEGWTAKHDDQHETGEIALAAACYAIPVNRRGVFDSSRGLIEWLWPWDAEWWKPARSSRSRIKELVKAGALIAAEIDRLQRRATNKP